MPVTPIQEVIKAEGLLPVLNKYNIQIVHEDNDTYWIEDMKYKRSMTRGRVVDICKTQADVIRYLKNLSKLEF